MSETKPWHRMTKQEWAKACKAAVAQAKIRKETPHHGAQDRSE